MKEVVVDTNVFVSALITPQGPPRKILTKIFRGKIGLVISPRLLLEVVSVFARPKLRLLIPESKISDLASLIHQSARIIKPTNPLKVCRDPKDDAVLECALAGGVSSVITGDGDLLTLDPFRGIRLMSPKDFLEGLKSS
jgi:putative PIN family toxin of toxin-antitoxin system